MLTNSSQIKKWKTLSDLIIAWLTIAGTLVGGGMALFQYIENSNADRAKETLKFIERFEKDNVRNSVRKVDIFMRNNNEELVKKMKDGGLANFFKEKIPLEAIDLDVIFDLYDQLDACVKANLCDNDIAIRFFGKYAYELTGTFYPYIELYIKESGDVYYGKGIKYFSVNYAKTMASN